MSSEVMTNADRRVRAGHSLRVLIWLAVVAAVVVFALVNTEKVRVDWVVNDALAPLWAVIGASAAAGAIVGYLAHPRRG
jgi:uncharacterized integral membrane protein